MRVLLDECLPNGLSRELVGHEARTAPEIGWASKRNGELLALATGRFDVFLTVDRNLSYQQDLSLFDIAIVMFVAHLLIYRIRGCHLGDESYGDATGSLV